jgi:predicted DNA-binding WGR domain protein
MRTSNSGNHDRATHKLYIERVDPAQNMARYYALSIEPTLFGEASVLRRWGRVGSRGQQKLHLFADERSAVDLFLTIVRQKRARGYKPKVAVDTRPHD